MFIQVLLISSIIAALTSSVNAVNGRGTSCRTATYYTPDGRYGACGAQSQNYDNVVALSFSDYDGGANCWRHIGVNYQGRFVDVTVVDLCTGCESGHIDLSLGAFETLADTALGIIPVEWDYE